MEVLFYIFLFIISVYGLFKIINANIVHPEIGDKIRIDKSKQKYNLTHTNDGQIKCPKCRSTQIQLMKRGWKITTGFLGSSRNERVCMNCKHKF